MGLCMAIIGVIKGDTRSLDYGSFRVFLSIVCFCCFVSPSCRDDRGYV